MKMEKFIKPLIEVIDVNDDIICTSGGGTSKTSEDPTEIVEDD